MQSCALASFHFAKPFLQMEQPCLTFGVTPCFLSSEPILSESFISSRGRVDCPPGVRATPDMAMGAAVALVEVSREGRSSALRSDALAPGCASQLAHAASTRTLGGRDGLPQAFPHLLGWRIVV